MTDSLLKIDNSLLSLGFSDNLTGGHTGRSMMFEEISILFKNLDADTSIETYKTSILKENVLGKTTFSSREQSYKHLVKLYSLDPSKALFRVLRKFAEYDSLSLPLLAMICSYCRDPQLRSSFMLIDSMKKGEVLIRARMEEHLENAFPHKFSIVMKQSLAQHVNTSWTVVGHLTGKAIKKRSIPKPQLVASVYAMFAGYLAGLRGEMLIDSVFGRLVAQEGSIIKSHLAAGSARGWLRYRSAGGITEIDFTPMLTTHERELLNVTA